MRALGTLLLSCVLAGCYDSHTWPNADSPDLDPASDDGAAGAPAQPEADAGPDGTGTGGAAGSPVANGAAGDEPGAGDVDGEWGPGAGALNEPHCDTAAPLVLEIDWSTRWGRVTGWLEASAKVTFQHGLPKLTQEHPGGLGVWWTVAPGQPDRVQFNVQRDNAIALAAEPTDFEAIDIDSLAFASDAVGPVGPGAIVVHRSSGDLLAVRVDSVQSPSVGANGESCVVIDATWVFATPDVNGRLRFGAPE